jgi:hypothetical protein
MYIIYFLCREDIRRCDKSGGDHGESEDDEEDGEAAAAADPLLTRMVVSLGTGYYRLLEPNLLHRNRYCRMSFLKKLAKVL